MRTFLLGILMVVTACVNAQEKYPKDIFQSPLDIPLVLAGTFGELRSNHFHSGIDIKTNRRQGLPVYAIAEGTVTRIKISTRGYGKALYVAHPNGHTSVYAHLQKFNPELEAYINKVQYAKKSFEVEVFPEYGELKVAKGEVMAFSGNTGGSSGPHLHFEIRKTVTEKPTNPLLYGYNVRDATSPTLVGLYGYPLSENSHINKSGNQIQLNFSKQKDGSFLADKVEAMGTIGLGFHGFDRQDLAANKNGVYAMTQKVNGTVFSSFDFETFSFGETRYINTFIDYAHYGKYKRRIQKCFRDTSNHLGIYDNMYNDGKILVQEGSSYTVEILITDVAGNITRLVIPIVGKRTENIISKPEKVTPHFIAADKPYNFDLGAAKVYFPKNTFYSDFYLDLAKGADTVRVHNNTIAAHRNYTLDFNTSRFSPEERKQLFIARLGDKGKPIYQKTYKKGKTFSVRTRTMGTYFLECDTLAPTIKPRNFKKNQWLTNYKYLSLEIKDDLSGIQSYNATLNGKWILMEYEPKRNTLTYSFDEHISNETEYTLEVVGTDNVGNSHTFTSRFFKK